MRIGALVELRREGGKFEIAATDSSASRRARPSAKFGTIGGARAEDIARRPERRATTRIESGHGACGSVLTVDPMFSANVVAPGLIYRERFTENRDARRNIFAEIPPYRSYSRRCAAYAPSGNDAPWSRSNWQWWRKRRPGRGK